MFLRSNLNMHVRKHSTLIAARCKGVSPFLFLPLLNDALLLCEDDFVKQSRSDVVLLVEVTVAKNIRSISSIFASPIFAFM